ncbi:MAG: lysophospholipid acyltransferase family protein [Gemmatimonadales bacterium]
MSSRVALARLLGPPLFRGLAASWRYREPGPDGGERAARNALEPAVHAVWHAELLAPMLRWAPAGMAAMISRHRDGEIAATIVEALGSRVVRGSSSSGGTEALLGMVDLGRQGVPLAITPDGPRGPARVCKPGVVRLAARSGLPVVPVGAYPSNGWRLRSWDRFIVPRPFTKVHVEFGPPIDVPPDAETTDLEGWIRRIENALSAVSDRCRRRATGESA